MVNGWSTWRASGGASGAAAHGGGRGRPSGCCGSRRETAEGRSPARCTGPPGSVRGQGRCRSTNSCRDSTGTFRSRPTRIVRICSVRIRSKEQRPADVGALCGLLDGDEQLARVVVGRWRPGRGARIVGCSTGLPGWCRRGRHGLSFAVAWCAVRQMPMAGPPPRPGTSGCPPSSSATSAGPGPRVHLQSLPGPVRPTGEWHTAALEHPRLFALNERQLRRIRWRVPLASQPVVHELS